ncbi:MAG: hypothetical protein MGG11_19065 [Trichodesmium sp. MAG_R03]|nr:hypothetical protein [Trichodesmium sp. MAG_R03]
MTTNDVSDDQVFSHLLDGVDEVIAQASGGGAYDKYKCYEKARQGGAKTTIPPRKNVVNRSTWQLSRPTSSQR